MAPNGSRLADVIEKELKAKLIQMKIELQKIIDDIKARKSNADSAKSNYYYASNWDIAHASGASWAYDLCIQKLTLLLNSESDKIGKNDADNIGKPM